MYLFMSVLEDWRESGQQILDWRSHLGHPNHIHNGLEGAKDGAQYLRVLFS